MMADPTAPPAEPVVTDADLAAVEQGRPTGVTICWSGLGC
jgi:hypothetical protein